MMNVIGSFRNEFFSLFNQTISPLLAERNKKIAAVAIIIFVCIAACYAIYNCRLMAKLTVPPAALEIEKELDKSKELILNDMARRPIKSAKLFVNITAGEQHLRKECIIRREGDIDREFLSQELEKIISETKESIHAKKTLQFKIDWHALLKGRKDMFFDSEGSRDSEGYSSGGYSEIDPSGLKEYIKLTLKTMNREIKPQLNDELEFI